MPYECYDNIPPTPVTSSILLNGSELNRTDSEFDTGFERVIQSSEEILIPSFVREKMRTSSRCAKKEIFWREVQSEG